MYGKVFEQMYGGPWRQGAVGGPGDVPAIHRAGESARRGRHDAGSHFRPHYNPPGNYQARHPSVGATRP